MKLGMWIEDTLLYNDGNIWVLNNPVPIVSRESSREQDSLSTTDLLQWVASQGTFQVIVRFVSCEERVPHNARRNKREIKRAGIK